MVEYVPLPLYPNLSEVYILLGAMIATIFGLIIFYTFLQRRVNRIEDVKKKILKSIKGLRKSISTMEGRLLDHISFTEKRIESLDTQTEKFSSEISTLLIFKILYDLEREEKEINIRRDMDTLTAFLNYCIERGYISSERKRIIIDILSRIADKWTGDPEIVRSVNRAVRVLSGVFKGI
jgi:predicted PurR-regulated permease PerM